MFDPRPVAEGQIVHLRFLACVLRVADVLENDPERTPEVIFRHRDISLNSRIYWWKDHGITVTIPVCAPDQPIVLRQIGISARPRNAAIHNAILQTARGIEDELRVCAMISANKDFSSCPGHPVALH